MAKKDELQKKSEEIKDQFRVQLEQSLCELIVAHRRIEYIAYRTLSEDEYKQMCKNVSEFVKKICTIQK